MIEHTRPATLDGDGRSDPWAEFRVTDPYELLRLLRQLRDHSVPVHLSAPQGQALTSQLWSLDEAQAQLNFCADADSVHLQRMAQADEAVAVAYLESVKLQFDLADLLLVHGNGASALRAMLPAVLYRFQRRDSFRLRSGERHAPQARLRHPSIPEMQLCLRIVDLSVGGCALALPDDVPALQPGSSLQGVQIEIDSDTRFSATLRLLHVSALHGGGAGARLGCEWQGLDGAAQRALQRYIDRAQQRRRVLAPR